MNFRRTIPLLYLTLFFSIILNAQVIFQLENSSFEGRPSSDVAPTDWSPCGDRSTPDILPGAWDVTLPAASGNTYLGLVARSDGSVEAVQQKLVSPLRKNTCYQFSVFLALSNKYAGFNQPICLKMYGGNSSCKKQQELIKTPPVMNYGWIEYSFQFFANDDYEYFYLEAGFVDAMLFPYNGNILIDRISPFYECMRVEVSPSASLQDSY